MTVSFLLQLAGESRHINNEISPR